MGTANISAYPYKDANPLYTLAARAEGAEDNSSVALDWSSLCSDAEAA